MSAASLARAQPWLGTRVEIRLSGLPRADLLAASGDAFAAVAEVDRRMSFHAAGSDLSRLHASAGAPVAIHPWTYRVLAAALAFENDTDGAFDATVAPRLVDWRLLPRPAGARRRPRPGGGLRAALELLPDGAVRLRQPAWIDLGGIAKGFAVDRAIDRLRAAGVPAALVNAGGDLRAYGRRWRVTVRDPRRPDRMAGTLTLEEGALATSGPYATETERRGHRVSALVDARAGTPIVGARGVSILAPTCMAADALTKAALVLPPARLQKVLSAYGARRWPGPQTAAAASPLRAGDALPS